MRFICATSLSRILRTIAHTWCECFARGPFFKVTKKKKTPNQQFTKLEYIFCLIKEIQIKESNVKKSIKAFDIKKNNYTFKNNISFEKFVNNDNEKSNSFFFLLFVLFYHIRIIMQTSKTCHVRLIQEMTPYLTLFLILFSGSIATSRG